MGTMCQIYPLLSNKTLPCMEQGVYSSVVVESFDRITTLPWSHYHWSHLQPCLSGWSLSPPLLYFSLLFATTTIMIFKAIKALSKAAKLFTLFPFKASY